MRSVLFFFLIAVLLLGSVLGGVGCANIIPPQGGPRDSLPPQLLRATPPDSSVNFAGRRIVLEFDEFIDAQNMQSVLVTPYPETPPTFEAKLRNLTVTLRDTLEANTTYTINFGDAIKDVNEGNILRNFDYTFATGAALDSLTFRGNVLVAETGRIDSNMVAVLYRNLDDSAIINDRPRYIARLDRSGAFEFRNLPTGTFALYAFGDVNSRRYPGRAQLFAFADSPIVVRPDAGPVTLYAYRETPPATPATGARPPAGAVNRLTFGTNLSNNALDLLGDLVLTFEHPLRSFDSTGVRLTRDSTFAPVAAVTTLDTSRRRMTVDADWQEGTAYQLILDQRFAEDTLGRRLLKSDTVSFATRKRADYGSVVIRLKNIDLAQNPVLQFIQNNNVVQSVAIPSGTFRQELFLPGDYELRVLYDRNGNGQWDAGTFFGGKRQPELVKPVERRVNVKANWDNEFEIEL
ncbi:MAG TPA: Ig-like domain-containing protein [Chitinophagaceae bacterium]